MDYTVNDSSQSQINRARQYKKRHRTSQHAIRHYHERETQIRPIKTVAIATDDYKKRKINQWTKSKMSNLFTSHKESIKCTKIKHWNTKPIDRFPSIATHCSNRFRRYSSAADNRWRARSISNRKIRSRPNTATDERIEWRDGCCGSRKTPSSGRTCPTGWTRRSERQR